MKSTYISGEEKCEYRVERNKNIIILLILDIILIPLTIYIWFCVIKEPFLIKAFSRLILSTLLLFVNHIAIRAIIRAHRKSKTSL